MCEKKSRLISGAGNHDLALDEKYTLTRASGWTVKPHEESDCRLLVSDNPAFHYLEHSDVRIEVPGKSRNLHVFGSPYSPDRSRQNWAFQYPDTQAEGLWDAVPAGIDVLITHTPPKGVCDMSQHWQEGGCPALLQKLWHSRPLLQVCGHCHEGRGVEIVRWGETPGRIESTRTWEDPGRGNKKQALLDLTRGEALLKPGEETAIVNASVMAKSFGRGPKTFNKPIVVDLPIVGLSPNGNHPISDKNSARGQLSPVRVWNT